jgi:hypothetical protein
VPCQLCDAEDAPMRGDWWRVLSGLTVTQICIYHQGIFWEAQVLSLSGKSRKLLFYNIGGG